MEVTIPSPSDTVFRTCFAITHSLWPVPFPPLSPRAVAHHSLCSRASSVVRNCPTSCNVHCRLALLDSRHGPLRHLQRPVTGSPGSRARSLHTYSGSKTTQGQTVSRDNETVHIAFRLTRKRRHPGLIYFSRLNNRPVRPLSTLRIYPYGYMRMTRGRCGSLFLHRMGLSPTTSRRF